MAMIQPGELPNSVVVRRSVMRVYERLNPGITDQLALEYGAYLRWLRIRVVERHRRPWQSVHCEQTCSMYFAYLWSTCLATDTQQLDRRIALTQRRLARIWLPHEYGTQYRLANGEMVGLYTTVHSPEYTREVYPLGYIVVRDVFRRHEVWQVGDRWGERQDWHIGYRVRTMRNGEARWCFTVVLGTQGHTGYCRVEDPGYGTPVRLDRYGRNVDRQQGDESDDLDLDSQPKSDPNLTD